MPTPARTDELIALHLGGCVNSAELIAWAVQALVDGCDTPDLRELAGLDVESSTKAVRFGDAERLFLNVLRDLEIPIPEREEGLRAHLRALAARMVNGSISPSEGLGRIETEVQVPLYYPPDLRVWYYLVEDLLYPAFEKVPPEKRDAAILQEARRTLSEAS